MHGINEPEIAVTVGAGLTADNTVFLTALIEHLLKRLYIPMPENYRGWENTIREQRRQLNFVLSDAPSLKSIWLTSFDRAWQVSLQDVKDEYSQINFPDRWPFSHELEAILNNRFWEEN